MSGVWQLRSGARPGFGQALFTDDSRKVLLPGDQRNTDRWFNTDVFNRKSTGVLAWKVRTAPPRYSSIRTDTQRRPDLSANKTFRITESLRAIFRADVFNARNGVVLRAPNTDPVNSAFGRVTTQEPPRSSPIFLCLRYQPWLRGGCLPGPPRSAAPAPAPCSRAAHPLVTAAVFGASSRWRHRAHDPAPL